MKNLSIVGAFSLNILLGVLLASIFFYKGGFQNDDAIVNAQNNTLSESEVSGLSLQRNYNRIAQIANPAVVSIQVDALAQSDAQNPAIDEFFRRFFGQSPYGGEQKRMIHGTGSGFLVSPNGYLVTNFHVVKGAKKLTVYLNEEKRYNASIVGVDEKTDLALLKLKSDENFSYLSFGDSDKLQVGDIVVAIGNPFNLAHTFTTGVVSAKGRNNLDSYINSVQDFIQTDVAINPGNSGGPLINLRGEVVGINSMILSPNNSGSIGIGFSIPSNIAKNIIEQLKKNGKVERGHIGITMAEITPEVAKALKLKNDSGVYITSVLEDSPAQKAGLKQGDVILSFNKKKIRNSSELINEVYSLAPETTVSISILRDKKTIETNVRLSKDISVAQTAEREQKNGGAQVNKNNPLKVAVESITDKNARRYKAPYNYGVVIVNFSDDSPLLQLGFEVGDIITRIADNQVRDKASFYQLVKEASGETVLFYVIRNGQLRFAPVDIPE